jgi:hypothetical protein
MWMNDRRWTIRRVGLPGGAATRRVNAGIIGLLTGSGNRKNRPGDLLRRHPRKTRLNSEERS